MNSMKRITVLSAFLWLIILGCEEKKVEEKAEVPPISIEEVLVSDNNCSTDSISCTYAHVTYPVFSDSSKSVLNEQIVSELVAAGSSYFNEETIKVGVLHSLSGTMAISETTLKDTMEMLVEQQNAAGGVLGGRGQGVSFVRVSGWRLDRGVGRG